MRFYFRERPPSLPPAHACARPPPAPAIFLRPMQAGPAGFGLLLLPGFCHFEDIGALELGAAERSLFQLLLILLWRVGCDPGFGFGTERGFLRGVIELHVSILSRVCFIICFVGWFARSEPHHAA